MIASFYRSSRCYFEYTDVERRFVSDPHWEPDPRTHGTAGYRATTRRSPPVPDNGAGGSAVHEAQNETAENLRRVNNGH